MRICPGCNKEISDKAIFCEKCGMKLEEKKLRYCPNCKSPNASIARFCQYCGILLSNGTSSGFLTAAGVMTLLSSCFCFLLGFIALIEARWYYRPEWDYILVGVFGIVGFAFGITGGILTLRRKLFAFVIISLALIITVSLLSLLLGYIFMIFGLPILILGVISTIFTSISVNEFKKDNRQDKLK